MDDAPQQVLRAARTKVDRAERSQAIDRIGFAVYRGEMEALAVEGSKHAKSRLAQVRSPSQASRGTPGPGGNASKPAERYRAERRLGEEFGVRLRHLL